MQRDSRGRFQKGSGGRKKGSRNRTTRAIEQLLEGDARKLTKKAIKLALDGHPVALKLVMERIAPAPRDRAILVDLPALQAAEDAPQALAAICAAVGRAEVTPNEGAALAALVNIWRDALFGEDLAARIEALKSMEQS